MCIFILECLYGLQLECKARRALGLSGIEKGLSIRHLVGYNIDQVSNINDNFLLLETATSYFPWMYNPFSGLMGSGFKQELIISKIWNTFALGTHVLFMPLHS